MIRVFIFMYVILSFLPYPHSATNTNSSKPNCPETFNCPGLTPFRYPFFNVTDTRCGLIKVNCTTKGGDLQLGGRSYEIVEKIEHHKGVSITIYNKTFDHLAKQNSCEVLMNNFTSPSPTPLLYSILFPFNITIFKCPQNYTYAYFSQHKHNSYNKCKDHTCQVVQLPVKMPGPELDETNIFSLLSSNISIRFNVTHSYDELAFQCLQYHSEMRPRMNEVLDVLMDIQASGGTNANDSTRDFQTMNVFPLLGANDSVVSLTDFRPTPVSIASEWQSSNSESTTLSSNGDRLSMKNGVDT